MVDRTKPVCAREDVRDSDDRDSSHLRQSLDQRTIPQIDLDIDPLTNTTRLIGVVETENVDPRSGIDLPDLRDQRLNLGNGSLSLIPRPKVGQQSRKGVAVQVVSTDRHHDKVRLSDRVSCSWLLEKTSHVERSAAIDAEVQNGGRTRCFRSKVVIQPAGQTETFFIASASGDGVTEHDDSRDCIIHHRGRCDFPSCPEKQSDSPRDDQEKQGRHQPSHTSEYGVG